MHNIQKTTSCTIRRNATTSPRPGSHTSRLRRLGFCVLALVLVLTTGLATPASAGTKFQGTKFQGTKFQGTKFQGTKFQGTKLQGTKLQGTTLRASRRPVNPKRVRSARTCHAEPFSAHGAVSRQVCSISIASGR